MHDNMVPSGQLINKMAASRIVMVMIITRIHELMTAKTMLIGANHVREPNNMIADNIANMRPTVKNRHLLGIYDMAIASVSSA
ncbi:MAG: hypothetical protein ACXWMF_03480 [Syntrophales bacterium]